MILLNSGNYGNYGKSCVPTPLWNSGIPGIMGIMGRDDISLCRSYGKSVLHIAVSLSPRTLGIPEFRELWELWEE